MECSYVAVCSRFAHFRHSFHFFLTHLVLDFSEYALIGISFLHQENLNKKKIPEHLNSICQPNSCHAAGLQIKVLFDRTHDMQNKVAVVSGAQTSGSRVVVYLHVCPSRIGMHAVCVDM